MTQEVQPCSSDSKLNCSWPEWDVPAQPAAAQGGAAWTWGCLESWLGEKGSAGGLEVKWELWCGCQQLVLILSPFWESLAALELESPGQREVWAAPRVHTGGCSTNPCPGEGANARGH